jgi:hypothetical protein
MAFSVPSSAFTLTHLVRATMLVGAMALARPAVPCSVTKSPTTQEMLDRTQVIVRATATGAGEGTAVRFHVLEVIRGEEVPADFELRGLLVDQDDFNDQKPPYDFVRPEGRKGDCYATSYRSGGQFLLFLRGTNGAFNANWYPLGPTNEQLHSEQDPWLLWVREQEQKKKPR